MHRSGLRSGTLGPTGLRLSLRGIAGGAWFRHTSGGWKPLDRFTDWAASVAVSDPLAVGLTAAALAPVSSLVFDVRFELVSALCSRCGNRPASSFQRKTND